MDELIAQLLTFNPDAFSSEQVRNTENLKRLYFKLHRLETEIREIDKELSFYSSIDENRSEIAEKVFFDEEINALTFILEELERKNIELENQCLSAPKKPNTPMLNDIVEEFTNKCIDERNKNKKIGLYIKKEFYNSKNEEIEKLKNDIKEVNKRLNNELETINELEERETELLQNISVLERILKSSDS